MRGKLILCLKKFAALINKNTADIPRSEKKFRIISVSTVKEQQIIMYRYILRVSYSDFTHYMFIMEDGVES